MLSRLRRVVVGLVVVTALWIATPAVQAAHVENFHLLVTGVATSFFSTCPFDPPPTQDAECMDRFVLLAQEASPRDQVRRSGYGLFAIESHIIVHPDGSVDVLDERLGFADDVDGFVDGVRLLPGRVTASVPMNDGTTLSTDLRWDMAGTAFNVAGTDGPIQEEGAPWGSHLVDRCLTENWHAHQTYRREGVVTGSIDGVDVATLYVGPGEPFVGRGVFTIEIAQHGPRCA